MRTKIIILLTSLSIGMLALPVSASAETHPKPASSSQTHSTSQPAGTSQSSSDPGSNLANWLKSWVGALFGVIVGAVGLGAVAKRSVAEGLALLLVALIVGGFVIAPETMNSLTQSVWTRIAG